MPERNIASFGVKRVLQPVKKKNKTGKNSLSRKGKGRSWWSRRLIHHEAIEKIYTTTVAKASVKRIRK
jgi:hypothetical protein